MEWPGSRPLDLEPELGPDCGGLAEWPREHVVKCLCFCHPDDDAAMWAEQLATLTRLFTAARRNDLEFLLEVVPSKVGPTEATTVPAIVARVYDAGICPDWWKLEPMRSDAEWRAACEAITARDPRTRGVLVLGLDAASDALEESLARAARHDLVKGFAVGRTIFGGPARAWLKGEIDDAAAVSQMVERYRHLCDVWDRARKSKEDAA